MQEQVQQRKLEELSFNRVFIRNRGLFAAPPDVISAFQEQPIQNNRNGQIDWPLRLF